MNPEHERIVSALEREITPVKMKLKDFFKLMGIPILIGIFARISDFSDPVNVWIFCGIILIIVLPMIFFVTQCVDIGPTGILITGPFRKSTELKWEEVTSINYSRKLRWISIRGQKGIAYFNSFDGLEAAHDLAIVVAYRTGYKCPPKIKEEITNLLDQIDYEVLISHFKNTDPSGQSKSE